MLTDFGLMKDTRATTQITQAGTVIGTFDYAAPEQLHEARSTRAATCTRSAACSTRRSRQGPVPARDRRGDDARAPGLAAAVGARPYGLTRASGSARSCAARWRRSPARATRRRRPRPRHLAAVDDRARAAGAQRRHRRAGRDALGGAPSPPTLAARRVRGAFVGRADPLATLDARYAAAEAGQRQFVLLAGEPGIGKTRLATEFARRATPKARPCCTGARHPSR